MLEEFFKKKKVTKNIFGHPKIGTFPPQKWSFLKSIKTTTINTPYEECKAELHNLRTSPESVKILLLL